jgi:molybdopterin/thiamine biosynthesis adenylyltransferase
MNDEELLRYSRHILLDDFDISGQEALKNASILLVGAGGLGCPAAMYLAASGIGAMTIADDDCVDITNLQRQIAHTTNDVGSKKIESLAHTLRAINPHCVVNILPVRLQGSALQEQVECADIVVDCSDNFSTRLAINSACVASHTPLVSGAAIRYEGQVAVFNRTPESPCYACLYGADSGEENLSCSESGIFAPLVGVIGSMQAAEVLKILTGIGAALDGRLLLCDIRDMEWRTLKLKKDAYCSVCGVSHGVR